MKTCLLFFSTIVWEGQSSIWWRSLQFHWRTFYNHMTSRLRPTNKKVICNLTSFYIHLTSLHQRKTISQFGPPLIYVRPLKAEFLLINNQDVYWLIKPLKLAKPCIFYELIQGLLESVPDLKISLEKKFWAKYCNRWRTWGETTLYKAALR